MARSPYEHPRRTPVLCALLSGLFLAGDAQAENWSKELFGEGSDYYQALNLNFLGGVRLLDSGDWEPLETQVAFGLDLDYTRADWPLGIGIVGTIYYSTAEEKFPNRTFQSDTIEFQFGLRKVWYRWGAFRPYVGGGGSYLSVEVDDGRSSETADGFGGWVGVGSYYNLFDWLNLGVDFRWSTVSVEFDDGNDPDAGGWLLTGLVGYHWRDW